MLDQTALDAQQPSLTGELRVYKGTSLQVYFWFMCRGKARVQGFTGMKGKINDSSVSPQELASFYQTMQLSITNIFCSQRFIQSIYNQVHILSSS